jgi:hypothetical protein
VVVRQATFEFSNLVRTLVHNAVKSFAKLRYKALLGEHIKTIQSARHVAVMCARYLLLIIMNIYEHEYSEDCRHEVC